MPIQRYHRHKKRFQPYPKTKPPTDEKKDNSTEGSIVNMNIRENSIAQPACSKKGILPTHPFRMYIVGASGSGKTNFLLNLLSRECYYKDYFDSILVISPTALQLDETYKSLKLPDRNYYEPDTEVLQALMDIMEERIEEAGGKHNAPKVLLILDDIVSYKKFCNSSLLLKFAVMSRHWNISMVILSQAYHRIPKSVRLQMSSIVYFKGSNRELDVLADDFGAPGYTHKQFKQKIADATNERYSFVFIDTNRPTGEGRYKRNLTQPLLQEE